MQIKRSLVNNIRLIRLLATKAADRQFGLCGLGGSTMLRAEAQNIAEVYFNVSTTQ
jgi:hypothetical protein